VIFYEDTVWGGTPEHCQEFNLVRPTGELNKAIENDEPFVLLSRPEVFDMSKNVVYTEHNRPSAKCAAGKMLSIMEKKVLEYDKGHVIRACHIVSDLIEEMKGIASQMPGTVSSCDLHPVSMEVVRHVALLMPGAAYGKWQRVVNVPRMASVPLAAMAYRMSSGEFDFDVGIQGLTISQDYVAAVDSVMFNEVFGSMKLVECMAANEMLILLDLFGEDHD